MSQFIDREIDRVRWTRAASFVLLNPLIGLVVAQIAETIISSLGLINADWSFVLQAIYWGVMVAMTLKLAERSIIINDATTAFVTNNPFAALFRLGKDRLSYGPGWSFCFFWESRSAGQSVNLEGRSETAEFTVQCSDGALKFRVGLVIQPIITRLSAYILGVGNISEAMQIYLKSVVGGWCAGQTVEYVIGHLDELNQHMKTTFDGTHTEIEERFGADISNPRAEPPTMSDELQRTLSAAAETRAMLQQVIMRACTVRAVPIADFAEARKNKVITDADMAEAQRYVAAASGNMDNVARTEWAIEGLSPDVARAIAAAGPALLQALGNRPQGGNQPNNPPQQGRRNRRNNP